MCAGLVGPKSENVEKPLVLQAFLKGQGSHGGARESLPTERAGPVGGRKSGLLVKNASCRFGEMCFLLWQEAHFCKKCEKYGRKVKNAPKKP